MVASSDPLPAEDAAFSDFDSGPLLDPIMGGGSPIGDTDDAENTGGNTKQCEYHASTSIWQPSVVIDSKTVSGQLTGDYLTTVCGEEDSSLKQSACSNIELNVDKVKAIHEGVRSQSGCLSVGDSRSGSSSGSESTSCEHKLKPGVSSHLPILLILLCLIVLGMCQYLTHILMEAINIYTST